MTHGYYSEFTKKDFHSKYDDNKLEGRGELVYSIFLCFLN